jgi:hypothetical protein
MVEMKELHVLPHERSGGWLVELRDGEEPLSWHDTAGEAEGAARRHAEDRGECRIFVHDRYRRVRAVPARH